MHIGKGYGKNIQNLFDQNILFTFLNYITKTIFYPIITLCVPFFLDDVYQGYWYTFGSIGMLTTFADLGFTTIITQLSAHEYAYLRLENFRLKGDKDRIERLGSLFIFMLRWRRLLSMLWEYLFLINRNRIFCGRHHGFFMWDLLC